MKLERQTQTHSLATFLYWLCIWVAKLQPSMSTARLARNTICYALPLDWGNKDIRTHRPHPDLLLEQVIIESFVMNSR